MKKQKTDPISMADKIDTTNGMRKPQNIANLLNEHVGKPLDIGKSRGPLRDSGTTLPPISKIKNR